MMLEQEIEIEIHTEYLVEESNTEQQRYVFAYTITITNLGPRSVQLLDRYWKITDADNGIQEVKGEGVVGQQPHIAVNESFRYTSGAVLKTPVGTMEGVYGMISDEGDHFNAPIPPFTLADPYILH